MMADLDSAVLSPQPDPAPAPAPAPKAADALKIDPKPAAPAAAPKPEAAKAPAAPKPALKDEIQKLSDEQMAHLRQMFPDAKKLWSVVDAIKLKSGNVEAQLKAELNAIKSKPVEGAQDSARVKELEARLADMSEETKTWKQRVEEASYTHSEDYVNRFAKPYKAELERAIEEVKSLTMTLTKDGDTSTRQATEDDFRQAMELPLGRQGDFIHDTFGKSAYLVINRINRLREIKEASVAATSEHATNHEKTRLDKELSAKQEQKDYDSHFQAAAEAIKAHPNGGKYFSESEADPEGSALLKSGYERYDKLGSELPSMSPSDKAAVAAVVRSRFAAVPRLVSQIGKLEAKIAEFEAERGQLQAADPGAKINGTGGTPPPASAPSIAGMSLAFNENK